MSLNKAIEHKKEYRKMYFDSRKWDHSCRNHGTCSYCYNNRTYSSRKQLTRIEDEMDHWEEECSGPYDLNLD